MPQHPVNTCRWYPHPGGFRLPEQYGLVSEAGPTAAVEKSVLLSVDTDEDTIKQMALSNERAKKFINNKPVKKVIVVRNKLVNIVV